MNPNLGIEETKKQPPRTDRFSIDVDIVNQFIRALDVHPDNIVEIVIKRGELIIEHRTDGLSITNTFRYTEYL